MKPSWRSQSLYAGVNKVYIKEHTYPSSYVYYVFTPNNQNFVMLLKLYYELSEIPAGKLSGRNVIRACAKFWILYIWSRSFEKLSLKKIFLGFWKVLNFYMYLYKILPTDKVQRKFSSFKINFDYIIFTFFSGFSLSKFKNSNFSDCNKAIHI